MENSEVSTSFLSLCRSEFDTVQVTEGKSTWNCVYYCSSFDLCLDLDDTFTEAVSFLSREETVRTLHTSGSFIFLWFCGSINQVRYGRVLSRPAFTVVLWVLFDCFEVGPGSSNVYQTQCYFHRAPWKLSGCSGSVGPAMYRGLWPRTLRSSG